jgi:hypothetical protein
MSLNPEHTQFNSLTSPSDVLSYPIPEDNTNTVPLTDSELKELKKELNITMTRNYPVLEKYFNDPDLNGQTYCLHSFVPSKGAKPDKDGIYGMMKCRGAFQSEVDSQQRAEYLFRNVDSYHKIYTSFVGKPFPITESSYFSENTNEVNLKEKVKEVVTTDIKKKSKEEKETVEELERRKKEFELLSETNSTIDELDDYITAMVSRANFDYIIDDLLKKVDNYKESRDKSFTFIDEANKNNTTFRDVFLQKYIDKCKEVGIEENLNVLIKYMRKYSEEDPNYS